MFDLYFLSKVSGVSPSALHWQTASSIVAAYILLFPFGFHVHLGGEGLRSHAEAVGVWATRATQIPPSSLSLHSLSVYHGVWSPPNRLVVHRQSEAARVPFHLCPPRARCEWENIQRAHVATRPDPNQHQNCAKSFN